jgi:hypothetical protein
MRTRDEHDEYEAALRRLPEAHSLALRLREGGAPDDVICEYLGIEPEGLGALLELANQKLRGPHPAELLLVAIIKALWLPESRG